MWPYLKTVLRERRQGAGLTLRQLETPAGRDRSQLSRIETGGSGHHLEQLDRVIAAYAAECGATPLELWRDALGRWEEAERLGIEGARVAGLAAVERQR